MAFLILLSFSEGRSISPADTARTDFDLSFQSVTQPKPSAAVMSPWSLLNSKSNRLDRVNRFRVPLAGPRGSYEASVLQRLPALPDELFSERWE